MEEDKMLSESDSDDDSSDEANAALESKAEELERLISDNKYLYDEHLQLIDIYLQLADLTSMRQAYERFHEIYPLEPNIWLKWIKVEMKIANSNEEKKDVLKLFDKAIEDYLSVPLWLEYAQFALGCCELDETRAILERALNSAGLHCAQGCLIWDTLRELEMAHLSLTEPNSEDFQDQLQRVIGVFKRQLSVPLLNMERTYNEWSEFYKQLPEGTTDVKAIDWAYNKALKTLEGYKVYEDQLMSCTSNEELWVVYKEYIKSLEDPSVVLCVYERAVEKLCLTPEVWNDYCNFAWNLGEVALKISERAMRHLIWDTRLWIYKLRLFEKLGMEHGKVLECFEAGISAAHSPLHLWMAFLDYTKRNQSERLDKLFQQIEEQTWPEMDPSYEIKRYHAGLKASLGDMEAARKLWKHVLLDRTINTFSRYWLQYISLERRFGKPQQIRSAFAKALQTVNDQDVVAEEYLMFEREEGNLDDIMKCMKLISNTPTKVQTILPPVDANNEAKPLKNNKRKNETKSNDEKFDTNHIKKKPKLMERNKGAPADLDPLKSVFVSNIGPNITEDCLKEAFPKARVTLATDSKGVSRCFAFVQFETPEEAEGALQRDREPLNNRPMFISKCKPDRTERQAVFKYSTGVENNKLFVRGLPKNYTKEDVEGIFKEFNYTDVRLVLQRSGQSKGLAYVDFANDDDAERAMKATDNKMFGVYKINVAVSAPPAAGNKGKSERKEIRKEPKSRLQIPLIPQSVQRLQTGTVEKKSNADFRNMLLKK